MKKLPIFLIIGVTMLAGSIVGYQNVRPVRPPSSRGQAPPIANPLTQTAMTTQGLTCPVDIPGGATHPEESTRLSLCPEANKEKVSPPISQLVFRVDPAGSTALLQFQPTRDTGLSSRIVAYRFRIYKEGRQSPTPCSDPRQIDIDRGQNTREFNETIPLYKIQECQSVGIYVVQVNAIFSRESTAPLGEEINQNTCNCADILRDYYYVGDGLGEAMLTGDQLILRRFDTNTDGRIDEEDIKAFQTKYGSHVPPNTDCDVTGDGTCDGAEMSLLIRLWQTTRNVFRE